MYFNKKFLTRCLLYIFGMLILALGLTLNAQTNLGSSPIISIPYTLSFILPISFADLTLIIYILFVIFEFILKGKNRKWTDILQIPLSIVFTRFMNLFTVWFDFSEASFGFRFFVLILAILLTGDGAALTVDMNLIANPGDGFVQAVSMCIGKELGTAKNFVDISCVIISTLIGFLIEGRLLGVGLGTIIAMIGVGRVIALFNFLFQKKLAGLTFSRTDENVSLHL